MFSELPSETFDITASSVQSAFATSADVTSRAAKRESGRQAPPYPEGSAGALPSHVRSMATRFSSFSTSPTHISIPSVVGSSIS